MKISAQRGFGSEECKCKGPGQDPAKYVEGLQEGQRGRDRVGQWRCHLLRWGVHLGHIKLGHFYLFTKMLLDI